MMKKYVFSLFLIVGCMFGYSQPNEYLNMLIEMEKKLNDDNLPEEDVINLLLELSIEYSDINLVKADSFLHIGQTILDKNSLGYTTERGKYLAIKAQILFQFEELDSGFIQLNLAADYFKSVGDTINWAVCLIDQSNYYDQYLDNTTKVYEFAEKAIELFKLVNDTVGIAGGYNVLGTTNMNIGDYKHAEEQFTRAINLLKHVNNTYNLPYICYANRGLAYEGMEAYQLAKNDAEKALDISPDNCLDECLILEAKIMFYDLMLNDRNKERLKIQDLIRRLEDVENPNYKKQILEVLGDFYTETEEWDNAITYYNQALDLSQSDKHTLILLKKMAHVYENQSNFNRATSFYRMVVSLDDSLKLQGYQDQISHWQAVYREEEKLERIKKLQYQNKLNQVTITYQNRISMMLGGGLLIFGILSVILFKQKKKINDKNKILLEKHMKLESDWEIIQKHHKSLKNEIEELNEKFKNEHIVGEKYDQSGLSQEQIKRFLSILMYAITEDKVYLDSGISLSGLAEKLGVNRSYLSQVINTEFGKNFNQFINHYRVLEACTFLKDPKNMKYTIDYIAQISGFKSISSFNTAFKKQVGVTPSYYRKQSSGLFYKE